MKNWISKRYSGQAIAIIMVMLVVATIIGFSVYSRMQVNRQVQVDTKESTRALTQADTILSVFTTNDLATVQALLSHYSSQECFSTEEGCIYSGFSKIEELFSVFGLEYMVPLLRVKDWCSGEADSTLEETSGINLSLSYATAQDAIAYSVGDVFALNTRNISGALTDCKVTLELTGGEASFAEAFTTKKVYMDQLTGEVSPYQLEDMQLGCIGDCWTTEVLQPESSVFYALDDATSDPLDREIIVNMGETRGVYPLYEYRILPLKGIINIAIANTTPECGNYFDNYKIVSSVTCGDNTRTKMVIIPSPNNSGYSPLFDYTIYNATGVLEPD